jgi:hypothetical protein
MRQWLAPSLARAQNSAVVLSSLPSEDFVRYLIALLLTPALVALPRLARAQAADDTLPERVVAQAYDAVNRCDRSAYYSLFAPVWYHSVMEDSSEVATRQTRDKAIRELDPKSWWAACGDKPRTASPNPLKMIRRIVLGPYIVDEQGPEGGSLIHLDIFEVRHGKIVHEWESDNYASWNRGPSRH